MKLHRTGRFHAPSGSEEVNPMEGVANLADVMLVLACGLMLALITHWNVDVSAQTAVDVPKTQEISDVSGGAEGETPDGEGLQEYGRVYIDPDTGKLYMVADGE